MIFSPIMLCCLRSRPDPRRSERELHGWSVTTTEAEAFDHGDARHARMMRIDEEDDDIEQHPHEDDPGVAVADDIRSSFSGKLRLNA